MVPTKTVSSPKTAPESTIQSVQRAAAILRCFTQTDADLGVTEISKQLELHKSTVSRLLSTLQVEGLVEQNATSGRYRLGLGVVTLAGIVLERLDLPEVASTSLSDLAELTQETVNIVVLDGHECMNIGGAASPRPVQYIGRIGRRTPAHCTAAGKVLLAHLTSTQRAEFLSGPLPRFTDNTIIDLEALEQELVKIRVQGYAISHEEHQIDVSALAAPVCDHTSRVTAAVVISGPTYRVGPDQLETFIEPLLGTTRKISTQLGCPSAAF